jgi:hypothetical protein
LFQSLFGAASAPESCSKSRSEGSTVKVSRLVLRLKAEGEMNSADDPISESPESRGLPLPLTVKEKRTAEELAAMIHRDLSQIEGWPKRGVKVTVHGLNPWNSMLTFGVDAGPVLNKADLQAFCDIITERLKRLYDV